MDIDVAIPDDGVVPGRRPAIKIFTSYASPILSLGMIGSGKSTRTRWAQEYFYEGDSSMGIPQHKVIDLDCDARMEPWFMVLPNPYPDQYRTLQEKEPGWTPRGYDVEVLVPAAEGIPDRVPDIVRPFRIAFSDLDREEFIILLGGQSFQEKIAMEVVWNRLIERDGINSFIDFLTGAQEIIAEGWVKMGGRVKRLCDDSTTASLLLKMDRLQKLGVIGEDGDPYLLDIEKIMNDKKKITAFSFAFFEDKNAQHLIIAYLLRKIISLREHRHYGKYPPLVLTHRELQKSAPARGKKDSFAFEGQSFSTKHIKKVVEEPRDMEVRFLADTQTPGKVDKDIRDGFLTRFLFPMDLATLIPLTSSFYLDKKTFIGIQRLGIGECAIKTVPDPHDPENRLGIQYPIRNRPTRSWCKKPGDQFFSIWKELGLKFVSYKLERVKSVISIEIVKKEEVEAANLKVDSMYDFSGRAVLSVVKAAGAEGIKLGGIKESQYIKDLALPKLTLIRILNHLIAKKALEKDLKTRRYKLGEFAAVPQTTQVQAQAAPDVLGADAAEDGEED